jgi:hypothetical protein
MSCLVLEPYESHMPREPGEVPHVHRDDRADAVDEHRRDEVGVVDLLAPALNVGQQAD